MRFTLIAAAAMATRTVSAQSEPEQPPVVDPVPGTTTSQGCFSAKVGKKADAQGSFMSVGPCADACGDSDDGFTVAIVSGQSCYCANEYPPKDALVRDENCDYPCPGYPLDACGGLPSDDAGDGYFSVYNLGVKINVPNAKAGDDANDGEEDKPKDDSKEDNGEDDDGSKEDNGEDDEDDDEHHSPTPLWTASTTTSGTATVTTTASTTPTSNGGDNDDAQSSSATASPTPVESDPPEGAAAGLGLSIASVAGALAVVAAVF